MKKYTKMYQFTKLIENLDKPHIITIDITNKCNLKCKHCLNESGDNSKHNFSNKLSRNQLLDIADDIIKIMPKQCCICGGEPLLRQDVLFDLIKKLSNNNILVNMVSNGILMTEEVVIKLKDSGINSVQISVDGLGIEHDTFRCINGGFDKAIIALENLKNHDVNSAVSFCPNKLNYLNFRTYVKFLVSKGCSEIRMMPLLTIGRAAKNLESIKMSEYELHNFINEIHEIKKQYEDKIKITWGDPVEHIKLAISNINVPPMTFGITSVGNYYYSPYIPLYFGDIKNYSVCEFWNRFKKIKKNRRFFKYMLECNSIFFFNEFYEKYGEVNLILE